MVGSLKKGLVISSLDSARSSVAVCGQARKLAMSVAENMMLDDSIPQRGRAVAHHQARRVTWRKFLPASTDRWSRADGLKFIMYRGSE
jgi:hypothetical protein